MACGSCGTRSRLSTAQVVAAQAAQRTFHEVYRTDGSGERFVSTGRKFTSLLAAEAYAASVPGGTVRPAT